MKQQTNETDKMKTVRSTHLAFTRISIALLVALLIVSCSDPVEACFSVSQSNPIPVNSPVTFNCSCTTGGNGNFTWDFGDGSPKLTSTAVTVSHSYSTPGNYTIGLSVGGAGETMRKEHPGFTQTIIVQ